MRIVIFLLARTAEARLISLHYEDHDCGFGANIINELGIGCAYAVC